MGGFGIVLKANRKFDNNEFAVKISMKPKNDYLTKDKQDLEDEIKNMKKLHHPFIVNIIDDFVDSAGK